MPTLCVGRPFKAETLIKRFACNRGLQEDESRVVVVIKKREPGEDEKRAKPTSVEVAADHAKRKP